MKDKEGNHITWLEAIIQALRKIGHPANADEILKCMIECVVDEIPSTAKTPTQTIYGQIYTHSHDSPAGKNNENIFYKAEEVGTWGIVNNKTVEPEDGIIGDDPDFPEGRAVLEEHLRWERNSTLIKKAKEKFLKKHNGELYCEACGFNFYNFYGELGKDYIEAHHSKPVSEMKEGEKTKIDDLAMLCSNCHRMVHKYRPWISDRNELSKIISGSRKY